MKGIRKYTHAEREQIVEEMIPAIRRKFGDNLVALAAQGSFARGEDGPYSDLELIAFVKRMPAGREWDGVGKVRGGMLVELIWTTGESYLRRTRDVTDDWHLAGSDRLLCILNEPFIAELNAWQPTGLRDKCLRRAARHWGEVQESTCKVLNAIEAQNREGIGLLAFDMLRHMLIELSFLNHTPYRSFSEYVRRSRKFRVKPASFDKLLDLFTGGELRDLDRLGRLVVRVFSEFEALLEDLGLAPYADDVGDDELLRSDRELEAGTAADG